MSVTVTVCDRSDLDWEIEIEGNGEDFEVVSVVRVDGQPMVESMCGLEDAVVEVLFDGNADAWHQAARSALADDAEARYLDHYDRLCDEARGK